MKKINITYVKLKNGSHNITLCRAYAEQCLPYLLYISEEAPISPSVIYSIANE